MNLPSVNVTSSAYASFVEDRMRIMSCLEGAAIIVSDPAQSGVVAAAVTSHHVSFVILPEKGC